MSDRTKDAPVVAWEVVLNGLSCFVFAPTKGRAQFIAVDAYWESFGRVRGDWPRAKAFRAERFDKSAARFERSQAWSEAYLLNFSDA